MKITELNEIKAATRKKLAGSESPTRIVVGMATCGLAAGAKPVFDTLSAGVKNKGVKNTTVVQVGCIGMCRLEPIVEVLAPGKEKVTYVHVDTDAAKKILEQHIIGGKVVAELLAKEGE